MNKLSFKTFLEAEDQAITLDNVTELKDLKDPATNKYYTGEVNVTGVVDLSGKKFSKLPVKFGKVGDSFFSSNTRQTSLEGAPSSIGGNFFCSGNELTSLEGAPQEIDGNFSCENNKLTSLEGIHKIIKFINGGMVLSKNPITTGGIGLLMIEGLTYIFADHPAFKIINKYIGQGKKGLLRCQDALIEAGYEEFARL